MSTATGTSPPTAPSSPATGTGELLVRQVRLEAEGVVSLLLADPAGRPLAAWEPGAHLDLVLPSGLVRQYSLCGDLEEEGTYQVAVLLEADSRGGSKEVHETALVGRRLAVRGPRNHFPLVPAEDYLFLAGGIGITPILPMLQATAQKGLPFSLVYGGRSRSSMAFLGLLEDRFAGALEVAPEDEVGRPDLEAILGRAGETTAVYCCGPPGMLAAVEEACARLLRPGALHLERFGAPEPTEAVAAGEPGGEDAAFEVELARSGVVLTVPPDRSLLRVVLEAVPSHLYSCEEGYCGTCEARVLAGEPDHRDTVLTDEERADHKMMLCVGRSRSSRLVLDL